MAGGGMSTVEDLTHHLPEFSRDIFSALYRSDQRRAGETYLRVLLDCPGRKSIRRMASTAGLA